MKAFRKHSPQNSDDKNDLGFGSRLSQGTNERLLNRDGSFNVFRDGISVAQSLSIYHLLVSVSWTKFFLFVAAGFTAVNVVFAFGYYSLGPGVLFGSDAISETERFFDSFFFSVQTLATIGYGKMSPVGLLPNILVALEALFGLIGLSIVTGLSFARFARPNTKILYSNNAVIAPFKEGTAFMFRMINQRSSQLIQVEAQVIFSKMVEKEGRRIRHYHPLPLERNKVMFFPLHWTVVHYIDENSPMKNETARTLAENEAEFMILVNAVDETYSQIVYSRSSYRFNEIVWGAKFKDMFETGRDGKPVGVRLERIHEYDRVALD
ncbi:MAG: potassium transporter [Ignavibacteriales bacterium]|nr:potassium transporter [Ignavibacteriales bacterium]